MSRRRGVVDAGIARGRSVREVMPCAAGGHAGKSRASVLRAYAPSAAARLARDRRAVGDVRDVCSGAVGARGAAVVECVTGRCAHAAEGRTRGQGGISRGGCRVRQGSGRRRSRDRQRHRRRNCRRDCRAWRRSVRRRRADRGATMEVHAGAAQREAHREPGPHSVPLSPRTRARAAAAAHAGTNAVARTVSAATSVAASGRGAVAATRRARSATHVRVERRRQDQRAESRGLRLSRRRRRAFAGPTRQRV